MCEKEGIIEKPFLAFSREIANQRTYVQDLMKKERDLVVRVLEEQQGYLYICGNTKMGHDVQNLLREFFGEEGFKKMEKEKRIIKELWG